MPLHFERGKGLQVEGQEPAAVRQLRKNGSFLYFGGYDQLKHDIGELARRISEDPGHFHLAKSPKIHLVGYSLGGAAAMGAATAEERGRFASLSILFSNWGLASISKESVAAAFGKRGFGEDDWGRTMSELQASRESFDEGFRAIIWGEGSSGWFARFPKRVLLVHGLMDKIFPFRQTLDSSKAFFLHFQEAMESGDLESVFINSSQDHLFLRRREQIAAFVASFIGCVG